MRRPALLDLRSWDWRKGSRRLLALSVLAGAGWVCWKGGRDPEIPLLPPGRAAWIVYPSPPEAAIYRRRTVSADFERQFVLAVPPGRAELSWRAFRHSGLSINGAALPQTGGAGKNWKDVSRLDAAPYLRAGTNTITATVSNDNGPPALSLRLEIGGAAVETDPEWSVSVGGSHWHLARLASASAEFGEGNELHGLEGTGAALRKCWPQLSLLLLIATLLAGALEHGMARAEGGGGRHLRRWLVVGAAALWALLFLHNAPLLPMNIGFDASSHLQYITYIQEHHALPAATEGWEMFQAPLYYVLCACLLGAGGLRVSQPEGLLMLRGVAALVCAVNVALIWASLRLIFPRQWKKQMVGTLLAAFLPAEICLSHYTTNETLAAALVSAAFYLCLRILRAPPPSPGLHTGLGCALGLALLAKASAVVFLPAIFAVLAGKLIQERQTTPGFWVRSVGVTALFLVLVAGWRYAEVWRDFGSPLAGNWDARVTAGWWQQPGYHTPAYFFSFGRAFTAPLFSGFHSFWDCFYTTLWGDGMAGGRVAPASFPPWNWPLMEAGFLLALAPAALALTGLAAAVARCLREPDLAFLLLAGAAGSAIFAIFFMSLKLPFYAQGKCFYGLPALLPFCVFGVLGLDLWRRRGRGARAVLSVALLLWLGNVYASFWIQPRSLSTEVSAAMGEVYDGNDDRAARRAVDRVLADDPANETGLILDAMLLDRQHRAAAAVESLRRALRADPDSGEIMRYLASYLDDLGQTNEAFVLAQRAMTLEPENDQSAQLACQLAMRLGKYPEALDAGRAALGLIPDDAATQFDVGCAWANLGRPNEAIRQYQMLLALKPPRPLELEARLYLNRLQAGRP
jgi:tetratricopeptide (TPR) repeat protein